MRNENRGDDIQAMTARPMRRIHHAVLALHDVRRASRAPTEFTDSSTVDLVSVTEDRP